MTYNLDTFVNVTAKKLGKRFSFPVNELYNDVDLYERFPKTFANMFNYDAVNEQADPVFVYELKGEPVAFYDCELLVGYIVA